MCTIIHNSHDGRGQTVLGGRAVFFVCCVLIPCPFCFFMVSLKKVFVPTIRVLAERFSCVSNPFLSVMCRKCCSSV